jgi:hypothetical protein
MSLGHRSLTRRQAIGILAAGSAAAIVPTTIFARQDASPAAEEGGMPPLPEGATVVAEGLWNPGNLVFGPDGTLYIAETGVAGTPPEAVPATPGAMGPEPLVPPSGQPGCAGRHAFRAHRRSRRGWHCVLRWRGVRRQTVAPRSPWG